MVALRKVPTVYKIFCILHAPACARAYECVAVKQEQEIFLSCALFSEFHLDALLEHLTGAVNGCILIHLELNIFMEQSNAICFVDPIFSRVSLQTGYSCTFYLPTDFPSWSFPVCCEHASGCILLIAF